MLNPDEDLGRLASDALRVRHWMTRRVHDVSATDLVEPTRRWMDALGFSVAPVSGASTPRLLRRSALDPLPADAQVGSASEPIALPHLVDAALPLDEALPLLAAHGWFFALTGARVVGVVSTSDLRRPAVSQYVLGRLLVIERGLDHLLHSYGAYHQTFRYRRFTDTVNNLLHDRAAALRRDLALDAIHSTLAEAAADDAPTAVAGDDGAALPRGLRGTSDLRAWLFALRDLRNHLAHTGNLLDATQSAPTAHALVAALRALSGRVWTLVDDRPQLWRAYHAAPLVYVDSGEPVRPQRGLTLHVITAANPRDEKLSAAENARRHDALGAWLAATSHLVRPTRSSGEGWPDELGYAIQGTTRAEALALAARFQQRAIYELSDGVRRVIDVSGQERPRT